METAFRSEAETGKTPAPAPAGYVTMILDVEGHVLSCGTAAEKLLGRAAANLCGHSISDFIPGLAFSQASPICSARYVCRLSASDDWKEFSSTDAEGRGFPIELVISRVAKLGRQRIVFLKLRRPLPHSCLLPTAARQPP